MFEISLLINNETGSFFKYLLHCKQRFYSLFIFLKSKSKFCLKSNEKSGKLGFGKSEKSANPDEDDVEPELEAGAE